MSSPFPHLHRVLSPEEQASTTQPVEIEPLEQPEEFEKNRMWRFMPQPPDMPGTDSSVTPDPYSSPEPAQNQSPTQQRPQPAAAAPNPTPKPPQEAQQTPQPNSNTAQEPTAQPQPQEQPTQRQAQEPQQAAPQQPTADPNMLDPEAAMYANNMKPQREEVLFEWQSPSRPFKKHSRQHYSTIIVIASLISVSLLFASQFVVVAVIVALVFLYYVLMTTPPSTITQQLTTYGIRIENNLYYWEELGRFWFTTKHGQEILHIEVARFPNQLSMLLGDLKKDDMQAVLSEVLLHEQPPPTTYEKAAQWLHKQIPLDLE